MHTPGHSPGHVAYYFPGEEVLVGGDLIIGGSIGRTDLPDSDHRANGSLDPQGDEPAGGDAVAGRARARHDAGARSGKTNPFVQEILDSAP